jgi:DNA polymerase I
LAQQLGAGFSVSEARELIRLYFERFPTVKDFTDTIIADARSKGFTTTLYGRRRYFPDIHAPKMMDRKAAERQAVNAPIQGTAADMMKLAMIQAQATLAGSESRMLLTVHDEILFELRDGDDALIEPLRRAMEEALPLEVPVDVDAKIGPNWDNMTPIPAPQR